MFEKELNRIVTTDVKACIYVRELDYFFKYRMVDNSLPGTDVLNCTFEPSYNIEKICMTRQKATGMKKYISLTPGSLLITITCILNLIDGKKVSIHPD